MIDLFQFRERSSLNFDKIDNTLKEIKICDPAIGSGEFPDEMMNIISNIRLKLNFFYKKERSRYSFKLNYVENPNSGIHRS